VAAVYGQVVHHDFINYDDPKYVTENSHVLSGITWENIVWAFHSPHDANWIPLTWISHMADCALFGVDSGMHHLTNVVLHAVSTLLVFGLLLRMTGARGRSALAAFVFALHPLHVESVAWIAERKDVLSGVFWLLALWVYVNYAGRPSIARYAPVALLFCCALMSKPMAVTFPLVALVLDVWPLGRAGTTTAARLVAEKAPLFALAGVDGVITYLAQAHAGTVSSLAQIPFAERLQNVLVSYCVYGVKFLWPSGLAVFYPFPVELPLWQWAAGGTVLAAVTVLVWKTRSRRPYLLTGWLWYLVALAPVIGFVQAGAQARADRYTYIPMIGLSIMLAWGAAEGFERRPRLPAVAGAVACCAMAVTTWINLEYWRNSISLFRHAIDVTAENYVAYNNLGVALKRDGEVAEAVSNFRNAVRIRPRDGDAQDNLGEGLLVLGKTEEGLAHLEEAVRLRPDSAKVHADLASGLIRSGRAAEAEAQYRLAVDLEPENLEARYGLGGILMQQGRREEAEPHLRAALPRLMESVRSHPDDADLRYNLGTLLAITGRTDEAIAQFSEAIRLRPSDAGARFNFGAAMADRGRLEEARAAFAGAVQLRPDYLAARFRLGKILAALGRYEEAAAEFSEIIRVRPDFADAQRGLEEIDVLRRKSAK
jgi:tetratricopeptide (TPR) repeat protein